MAPVELAQVAGRYALIVERFDRDDAGHRNRVVSALTILRLTAFLDLRYATYVDFAHHLREQAAETDATLRELSSRISFNILCGNTDDHGRNHACLIKPKGLQLSPAYDICPQSRSGRDAFQAMAFSRSGARDAKVSVLIDSSGTYHVDKKAAETIVEHQIDVIRAEWESVCDAAELTRLQRGAFMGRQFLNAGSLE